MLRNLTSQATNLSPASPQSPALFFPSGFQSNFSWLLKHFSEIPLLINLDSRAQLVSWMIKFCNKRLAFQQSRRVDLSSNPYHESSFVWYDQGMLDEVKYFSPLPSPYFIPSCEKSPTWQICVRQFPSALLLLNFQYLEEIKNTLTSRWRRATQTLTLSTGCSPFATPWCQSMTQVWNHSL